MTKLARYGFTFLLSVAFVFLWNSAVFAQTPTDTFSSTPTVPAAAKSIDELVADWVQPVKNEPAQQEPSQADPQKVIYLTFDDGPDPKWTKPVLDLLNQYNAKATFFEIGRNVATWPDITAELAKAGQFIGNHSFSHTDLTKEDYNGFLSEISKTNSVIKQALTGKDDLSGQQTSCLRPPYGAADSNTYSYMSQIGLTPAFWNIDTLDWKGISPESILQNVDTGLNDANLQEKQKIVLMHDGGEDRSNTVDGLGLVLHEYTLRGYQFAPLCAD